jgi:predicted HD superfamily hydrolase involved in NAD metabolism
MERDDYLEAIKSRMPEKRFIHTIGVMETAIKLAEIYEENVKSAETAAILHDIAKYADEKWMIQTVKEYGLDERLVDWGPELLHGPVGAWIAEHEFEIHDEDILNSIRYHTTGRIGMSKLEKIIFIADMIEPNRRFDGVEKLRNKAEKDLDKAMRSCIRHSIKFLIKSKQKIYPLSIDCYNDFVEND